VAKELHLNWHTVKELEKEYMRGLLSKAGTPGHRSLGIDEISIRKGHTYRIVVKRSSSSSSDMVWRTDRTEASMQQFYDWLGPRKVKGIRLVVMDMWKPFPKSGTSSGAPRLILFEQLSHPEPLR